MRAFVKIANSTQLRTRNLSIGRNCLSDIPADTMAAAVVRLETVSLVDGDLTEVQVETIFSRILSRNPDELLLTQLDLREFDISSVCQDKLEGVRSIVTLRQCSPLSLVELQRGLTLIGREDHSVASASSLMP